VIVSISRRCVLALVAAATLFVVPPASAQVTLLNASYDVTREFYKDFNAEFQKFWKQKTGQDVVVNQSHGGSSRQARAVADGLEADVITMNQANDIDILHDRGNLLPADWAKRLPFNSAPYTSTTVFLVRKGNPKGIRDWDDLIRPGIAPVIPNPKTSGNGRYSYLAGWGHVIKKGGTAAQAADYVTKLFSAVPVFDGGGRGATTTFAQRAIGDVLLTFENEVFLIKKEFGENNFDIVYPPVSILAENPVALVDRVVDKKGTRAVAQAYLEFLFSEAGQELAAKHNFRPRNEKVAARYAATFRKLNLFTVDEVFGGWKKAQKDHFDDGGQYDRIFAATGKK